MIQKNKKGFMLIELMMVLSLGVVAITALLGLYLANRKADDLRNNVLTLQNNAKRVSDSLKAELKQAGYIGCSRLTWDFPITPYYSYHLSLLNKISVNRNEIEVRHLSRQTVHVLEALPSARESMVVTQMTRFKANDIVLIADCKHAEINMIKGVSHSKETQNITFTTPLHSSFDREAEVGRLEINRYYLDKSKQFPATQALFIEDIEHRRTEWVPGIENLQIEVKRVQEGSQIMAVALAYDAVWSGIKKRWYLFVTVGHE